MTQFPVVARELLTAARGNLVHRGRLCAAMAGTVVLGVVFLFEELAGGSASQSRHLFDVLAIGAFALCALVGLAVADAISMEKREGTLGLLFLTSLRGHDIILGKLAAQSLGILQAVLGLMPILSIAMLLGGIGLADVGRIGLVWVTMLFFSLACAALASTLSKDGRRATLSALGLILLGVFGPVLATFQLSQSDTMALRHLGLELRLLSPVTALTTAMSMASSPLKPSPHVMAEFNASLAFPQALGWMMIFIASRILPRVALGASSSRWRLRWQRFADRWSYGEGRRRQERRSALLDVNPFLWLAGRHQRKGQYVWNFVGCMAIIWLPWFLDDRSSLVEWKFVFLLFTFLFFVLKVWWAGESCQRLGDDRRAGALELLLTTPVSTQQFIRGHAFALYRMFLQPACALAAAQVILTVVVLSRHVPNGREIVFALGCMVGVLVLLVADAWAIRWSSLWQALTQKTAQRAFNQTVLLSIILPLSIAGVLAGAIMAVQSFVFRGEAYFEFSLFLCWVGVGLSWALFHGNRARTRFLDQFRTIASEGYRPNLLAAKVQSKAAVPRPASRWRFWTLPKYKLVLVALVLGPLLGILIHRAWWEHQVHRRIIALRAQRLPTNMKEWADSRPRYPVDSTAQPLLAMAVAQHVPLRKWSTKRYQDDESPVRHHRLSSERLAQLDSEIQANSSALESLVQAGDKPGFATGTDLLKMLISPNFQLWRFHNLMFHASAVFMDQGDMDSAVRVIRAQLKLAAHSGTAPGWLSVYDARSGFMFGLNALERLLSQHQLSESSLQSIHRALPDFPTAEFTRELLSVKMVLLLEHWRTVSSGQRPRSAGFTGLDVADHIMEKLGGWTGIREREVVRTLDQSVQLISYSNLPWHEAFGQFDNVDPAPLRRWLPSFNSANAATISDDELVRQAATAGRLRCAHVALQIELFRLRHGRLPRELDELPPPSVREFRLDPFRNAPLLYTISATGQGYQVSMMPTHPALAPSPQRPQNLTSSSLRGVSLDFTVER